MINKINAIYFVLGLSLIIVCLPYYLFLQISGLYAWDISAAHMPLYVPFCVVILFIVSSLFFYLLKRSKKFSELFSNASILFMYSYVPLLFIAFLIGLHGGMQISFSWNYICAATAMFVVSFFYTRNTEKQSSIQKITWLDANSSILQFLLIVIVFGFFGFLFVLYLKWYGIEFGKIRPLFSHGSTRSIWTQIPIYLICLGVSIWWPMFSVLHRTLQKNRYFMTSFAAAFMSILLIHNYKGIKYLVEGSPWQHKLLFVNLVFIAASFFTAALFWYFFYKTNTLKSEN